MVEPALPWMQGGVKWYEFLLRINLTLGITALSCLSCLKLGFCRARMQLFVTIQFQPD